MIARRFTLICLASALAGAMLAIAFAESGRTPPSWRQAPCDGAHGCAFGR